MTIFKKTVAGWLLAVLTVLPVQAGDRFITLSSTTSTQNSGLYDYLLPKFTEKTGIDVRVIAVGTGQALKLGENGDADIVIVHDRKGELKFVREGFGIERREFMYNDFVIVGPQADPAAVRGTADAVQALLKIATAEANFISRGDDSGTHRQELRLWEAGKQDVKSASGKWYKEIGASMGAALNTAAAMGAYTLTDRATWTSFKNRGDLEILSQGDPPLFNQYSVILVNPARYPQVKAEDARALWDFVLSGEGQRLIGDFKVDGITLFYPNAAERTAAAE